MERLFLQGASLAMTLIPACGGKIEQIRSARSGRQWLWRNPYLNLRPPEYGESYVEALDFGGWDEIFPSVGPCEVEGIGSVPDHGDLVGLPWRVDRQTPQAISLSVEGRWAPFRFSREIAVTDKGFSLNYEIEHRGEQPFPWLWCAHPLIAIEPGMQIDWGCGSLTVPAPSASGFTPSAKKFFTERASTDRVQIRAPGDDAESLMLQFDTVESPYLGFWVNFMSWSGCGSAPYFNLGVEPTTAPFDLLTDAVAAGLHRMLQPGECRRWSIGIHT